jgi:pimeloyl-ACP methyl ester carboxylesterase
MKETILFLHGALGASEQMKDLANQLIDYNVYCPDFSGHGSKAGETFTISSLVEDLNKFLHENNINQCHIFGYSMGGYVALAHETKYPGRVKTILTLGTKFNWSQETVIKETAMLQVNLMLEKIPDFCALLERRHGTKWTEVVENTSLMMHRLSADPILNHKNLSTLASKVVLGLGEKDRMVTVEETEWIKLQINGAVIDILPNTKHPIEQVNVDELRSWVKKWLS